jgi:hypothetical protein
MKQHTIKKLILSGTFVGLLAVVLPGAYADNCSVTMRAYSDCCDNNDASIVDGDDSACVDSKACRKEARKAAKYCK